MPGQRCFSYPLQLALEPRQLSSLPSSVELLSQIPSPKNARSCRLHVWLPLLTFLDR